MAATVTLEGPDEECWYFIVLVSLLSFFFISLFSVPIISFLTSTTTGGAQKESDSWTGWGIRGRR